MLSNFDEAKKTMLRKSNLTDERLQSLIEDKKEKYAGLLTDIGALYMIAKEQNIDLELSNVNESVKIKDLRNGLKNIDVKCVLKQINQPKSFEKAGKKGLLCNVLVSDESGECKLTLWHKDAEFLQNEKIEKGASVVLRNAFVSEFLGKPQLNLGSNGKIIVVQNESANNGNKKSDGKKDDGKKEWNGKNPTILKLNEIKPNDPEFDLAGRIQRIFESKTFTKSVADKSGNTEGRVLNFLLNDGLNTIKCVAWAEMTQAVEKIPEGSVIKIENAYSKQGQNGIEVHLGWKSRILLEPKNVTISEMKNAVRLNEKEINLTQANADENFYRFKATIADVFKGNVKFDACKKCGKKAAPSTDGWSCTKCGELKSGEVEPRAVLSIQLDDGFATMRANLFGKPALTLMNVNQINFEKLLNEKSAEEIISELKKEWIGKSIWASGKFRANDFRQQLEFNANSIQTSFNVLKEAEKLMEELQA